MKKGICFFILFVFSFTLLAGCNSWKTSAIGEIIQSGEWIYYTNNNSIYKIKTNDTEKTKLADNASLKTVEEGIIYYFGDSGFYRMNTDGTKVKVLFNNPTTSILVSGEWIYYGCKQPMGVYKIKTDGTEKTKLADLNGYNIADNTYEFGVCGVSENSLFYYIGENLYSMNTDGTGQGKVADNIKVYAIKNNWIIFGIVDKTEKNIYQKLCKMKLDCTEKSEIAEGEFEFLNIDEDLIYYRRNNITELYRINLDWTKSEKVDIDLQSDADIVWFRYVYGDWIYYAEQNELGPIKTYGINMDGTIKIDFNK